MHGLENHVNDEITQGNRVNGKVYTKLVEKARCTSECLLSLNVEMCRILRLVSTQENKHRI